MLTTMLSATVNLSVLIAYHPYGLFLNYRSDRCFAKKNHLNRGGLDGGKTTLMLIWTIALNGRIVKDTDLCFR